MRALSRIVVLSVGLLLCGCSGPPITQTPTATPQEIEAEKLIQLRMAREAELVRPRPTQKTVEELQRRMFTVSKRVSEAALRVCGKIVPSDTPCVFNFEVLSNVQADGAANKEKQDLEVVNAYADGSMVHVTPAMLRFTENDDELAFILAHELSHNILRHPQRGGADATVGLVLGAVLDVAAASQGVNTQGGFGQMGGAIGKLRYSIPFEKEADYVGLYIMANAGYNPHLAAPVWRRMSQRDSNSINFATSHPSNPDRFVVINKVADEIDDKKRRGLPLLPNLVPKTQPNT